MTATELPGLFDELSFGGEWRRYQKAAIAAFDSDRAAGRRRTHIVAPPGSDQVEHPQPGEGCQPGSPAVRDQPGN